MNTFRKTVSGIALMDLVTGALSQKETDSNAMSGGICNRTITEYIHSGNLGRLKNFLEARHVNVDDRDEDGNTPLMLACSLGRLDFVSLLLLHGADANAENAEKLAPLHVAADAGHTDVCSELIDSGGASVNAMDVGHWTPYIWACYRGRTQTVEALLSRGADVNAKGIHHVSGLVWAAGRNCPDLVRLLLDKNIKVDVGDRYGTTALIWAARKGRYEIVDMLLRAGANVDTVGMYSWTPLLVATMGNYPDVAHLLLERSPNVNAVDKDGMTALAIACKEGYEEIAGKLISVGAYINLQDRAGDTNLIHATKGGHVGIVEALLKKFADINVRGKDQKTCLHWAIDKNHARITRLILSANPDIEAKTVDGDTPLLRAVRGRNAEIVQMLLDKKAKIFATDRKGDTSLHIAMRARSKAVVETLLRNPKHSQLLYRPNRQGETPYNIDMDSPKTILGQVFGARRLNTNEDSENMLGYDLYSSALADILAEPSLSMPITVGLYAKWGSGKSFLLGKLKQEMKSFTREWVDPTFHMSPLLFFLLIQLAVFVGVVSWLVAFHLHVGLFSVLIGVTTSVLLFVLSYVFVFVVWKGSFKYDWNTLSNMSVFLAGHFNSLKLVLSVMFCHPPGGESPALANLVQPLRLLFTDQTKVITSTGGQHSVTQMIGSLLDEIEDQYGKFTTRLYRALRPEPLSPTTPKTWRRFCCIPYILLYFVAFLGLMASIILLSLLLDIPAASVGKSADDAPAKNNTVVDQDSARLDPEVEKDLILGFLIAFAIVVGVVLISNMYTIASCFQALVFSQRRHLQRAVAKLDLIKSEGYLQAVKTEVNLMLDMVKCLDAFTGQQSRLVVVVDGLDSCEQSKVLSVLDAVHMLFSDPGAPFIIILAIDPHVITKAIELNLNQAFSDTSIGGNAYIRNIVHLPFFLQNSGLRKVKVAQQLAASARSKNPSSSAANWLDVDESVLQRKLSTESSVYGGGRKNKYQKRYTRSKISDSVSSSIGSNINRSGGAMQGPQDLTKVLLNDDYFSDVNPRSMRRLMNVIYVMGRLLKAFHIDFNWYHLATWVNITEQWPYRLSWIILYSEMHETDLEETNVALKMIYDKIKSVIPTQKEIEPLLEMDRDEKKLDTFLSYHKKHITLIDMKIFLPFTINLDPYLKKIIKEEIQNMEEMGIPLEEIFNGDQSSHLHLKPLQTPNAPLTRRQAAGLTKKMAFPDYSHQPSNPLMKYPIMYPQPPQMWPYQGMPPQFQQAQNPPPPPPPPAQISHPSLPPLDLPEEVCKIPLSQKNLDEVCLTLRAIRGLTPTMVDNYCASITAQNLSGTVLANCSMDELKSVINMNFGDWELFKLLLLTLRSMEASRINVVQTNVQVAPSTAGVAARPESSSAPELPDLAKDEFEAAKQVKAKQYQTTVERQIAMEDAMISGLLTTLNEEAQEDIISEELILVESSLQALDDLDPLQASSSSYAGSQSNQESDVVFLSHTSPSNGRIEHAMTAPDNSLESGGSSWFAPRVMATSVVGTVPGGGGGSSAASWTSSQPDIKAVSSMPTSPTNAATDTTAAQVHRAQQQHKTSFRSNRARHIRDRLNSATSAGGGEERSVSFSLSDGEDDDPYAWLSKTAPASPRAQHDRSMRSVQGSEASLFQDAAAEHEAAGNEGQAGGRTGSGWLFDPSASMELLGETSRKVKKRLRNALHSMESGGGSSIPAVQRPRRPSTASDSLPLVEKGGGLFHRLRKASSSRTSPPSADEAESACSSPEEQETVARRPSMTSARGPHVQELFGGMMMQPTGEGSAVVTTVLPDGQIMTAALGGVGGGGNKDEQC